MCVGAIEISSSTRMRELKAPFTLAIRTRFERGNCDEPVSVIAGSFTLQGGRGGSTVVLFFGFVYIIQKSSEHNQRCSKIVEVDLVCLHDPKIL